MAEQPKLRVLVIDDEVTQRMLVKEYLEEAGHSVRLSEDGKRGFKMATATTPDIILLDLLLPSIDGYSLCKSFKANPSTADTPVILITASREADVIEKGLAAGADDFLTKPVDWAFLADRVQNVAAKAKERAEMARLIRTAHQRPAVQAAPEVDPQLEEMLRNTEAQLEQARVAQQEEKARLEAEHAEAMNRAMDELSAEYQTEFDTEIANREKQFNDALETAIAAAREAAEAKHRAELDERDAAHARALSALRAELAAGSEANRSAIEASASAATEAAIAKALAAAKAKHDEELRAMAERRELDLETARNSLQHEILVSERRYATEVAALKAAVEAANIRAAGATAASGKVNAAWGFALRSAQAQSILASAIAQKASSAMAGNMQDLAEADRAARSLNNLLANFKLLSQSMALPGVAQAVPVNVAKLATDVQAQAQRIAKERGVDVRGCDVDSSAYVLADESRVRYAWMSLVMNAIRFTPAGGFVQLTAGTDSSGATRLGVLDSGVGIAPNKLRELRGCLDEAQQDVSLRPGESAGLGIPVATALARQMGGNIEIDSQMGNGTQASLVFPAAQYGDHRFETTALAG